MVRATSEVNQELGLVGPPPGEKEVDPKTKVVRLATIDHNVYRRIISLSAAQKAKVKKLLKDSFKEWKNGTTLQNNKLRRNINRLEGISSPKNFPWPNSSNLNIPFTEIQILVASAVASSTMIESDPIWFIREMMPARSDHPEELVDPNIEWWFNWKFKKELKLDEQVREVIHLAFRDPLSVLVMDWSEELHKEHRIEVFDSVEEFQKRFPDPDSCGASQATYESYLAQISIAHEPLQLEVTEWVVKYRGPKPRVVELKDFIRVPVGSPNVEYTLFHGDQFRMRGAWFRKHAKLNWFYKDETEVMLKTGGKTTPIDDIAQQLDAIEGITSSNRTSPDEYDCIRGNLRVDLSGPDVDELDKEEELYHVVYHPESDSLLRMERYPYWHNRPNYIIYRIRKRTNRLLGRCFTDMLFDINEEINTQHNQRIDSRTITTVPSFKVNNNEVDLLSLIDRKQQHFYPGVVFRLSNVANMSQLDTKVDFQGTLQEETNLMGIGEMLTGATSARSGKENMRDPRAPAKKTRDLIGQSNQRIDDYIRELRPSMNETASQAVELYYQFSPDSVLPYGSYDEGTQIWIRKDIARSSLRNRNMSIDIARTSVSDNPDQVLQRALTDYQIWKEEPMVGGNVVRRWELIRDTMFAERKKNISKLLPSLPQLLQEIAQQQQLANPNAPKSLQDFYSSVSGSKENPEGGEEANGSRQGSPDMSVQKLDRSRKG